MKLDVNILNVEVSNTFSVLRSNDAFLYLFKFISFEIGNDFDRS